MLAGPVNSNFEIRVMGDGCVYEFLNFIKNIMKCKYHCSSSYNSISRIY